MLSSFFQSDDDRRKEIEIWNAAIEAAALEIEYFHLSNTGVAHPIALADAKRIRKLKK